MKTLACLLFHLCMPLAFELIFSGISCVCVFLMPFVGDLYVFSSSFSWWSGSFAWDEGHCTLEGFSKASTMTFQGENGGLFVRVKAGLGLGKGEEGRGWKGKALLSTSLFFVP